ncbi:HTH_Tnp_Tc3_2 domain-containing protein [Trichonephila clavipes]|nr:HTH_Tnp_Tc3_2 domain-containing protein [Trichonephila clavipes]
MPHVGRRKTYHHVSDFDKGRIVGYQDCGLWYHSIASRVDRGPITVSRILMGSHSNAERRAGSQWTPITSSREDRHINRMVLMDRAATSRALSQELGSFARQQVSA